MNLQDDQGREGEEPPPYPRHPALLAERCSTTAYATIAGRLAAPVTIVRAIAPLAAAALLHASGYQPLLAAAATSCALAAFGMVTPSRVVPPPFGLSRT